VSHILRTISQKLKWNNLIKYDLIKIYFRNKDLGDFSLVVRMDYCWKLDN